MAPEYAPRLYRVMCGTFFALRITQPSKTFTTNRSTPMGSAYQARWVTKQRAEQIKRTGTGQGRLVDSFKGYILVEPMAGHRGDGRVLSQQEADYELQDVWCTEAKAKLFQARRLLGLEAAAPIMAG
jgi:hypothetical protein